MISKVFVKYYHLNLLHSKNRWVEIAMKGYFNLKMHVLK